MIRDYHGHETGKSQNLKNPSDMCLWWNTLTAKLQHVTQVIKHFFFPLTLSFLLIMKINMIGKNQIVHVQMLLLTKCKGNQKANPLLQGIS